MALEGSLFHFIKASNIDITAITQYNISEIKYLLGWSNKNFLIEWKRLMTECGLYTNIKIDCEPKFFLKNLN